MTTKSFQAETILEALQMVQKEMGPDAVVISARNIPIGSAWQVWKKPGVEVICMSADSVDIAQGAAQKKKQSPGVLRSAENGSGVEFIEERPHIEWETGSTEKSSDNTKQASLKVNQHPDIPQINDEKHPWQPCYLRKEDVQAMNQILALRSQASESEPETGCTNSSKFTNPVDQSSKPQTEGKNYPEALRRVMEKLTMQGIELDYLKQLENSVLKGCSPGLLQKEKNVKEFLSNYMAANLPIRKWPPTEVPGRVIVFVGLTGSGKTNSLAKVAVFYSSLLAKKVVWVCADTVRTGAILEAKTYTEALGIPLELVYTPSDLKAVMERNAQADLILVDTPGFNPVVEEQGVELGSLLVEVPEAQILLVTSATVKEIDALSCYNSLKYFGLKGSVFSKLDETLSYGSVFNFTRKSHLPITFFTSSRKASAGLKLANAELLVDALFGKGW